MPANSIDISIDVEEKTKESYPKDNGNYGLQIFQTTANLLSHILIGCILAISLIFAFRNGLPLSATSMHITLCVIGYQLLMAQAILSLSPENGWSAKLTLIHKKRAHWILQLTGSLLAIIGSIVKILDKSVHWNTLHGQFALVALVFTSVSLVNGLTSLWAFELRRVLPGNLSKVTHICFGTVAYVAASITLCYGIDKSFFRSWSTDSIAYTFIGFISIVTFMIIVNPLISFYRRSKSAFQ